MPLESKILDGSEENLNAAIAYKDINNLKDAIQRENMLSRGNDDVNHTTIVLSSWTIRMFDLAKETYKIRNKRTFSCAVLGLGNVLAIRKYSEKAKRSRKVKNELLYADNYLTAESISSANDGLSADNLIRTKKRHIDFPKSLYNSFNDFAEDAALTNSSVYRCAIYLAFETVADDFPQRIVKNITDNIALYDDYIDLMLDHYETLKKGGAI